MGFGHRRFAAHSGGGLAVKTKRRGANVPSLTFLDVITCGFGAILILLIIVKPTPVNVVLVDEKLELEAEISATFDAVSLLKTMWEEIQSSIPDPENKQDEGSDSLEEIDASIRLAKKKLTDLQSDNEGLELVRESLEKATIQATTPVTRRSHEIGGIPVDSEYVIFIVDTSGSMKVIWERVIDVMDKILEIHPQVRGFQIMNDNGMHLYRGTRRNWLPDTSASRKNVKKSLRNWDEFSNSSPVEGLQTALNLYARKSDKISIYILGDDFTGSSYDSVIDTLDRMNFNSKTKSAIVRVHSIGFISEYGSERYATLMRAVTERNRGAFLGLPLE